jgi:hypothetical protein
MGSPRYAEEELINTQMYYIMNNPRIKSWTKSTSASAWQMTCTRESLENKEFVSAKNYPMYNASVGSDVALMRTQLSFSSRANERIHVSMGLLPTCVNSAIV